MKSANDTRNVIVIGASAGGVEVLKSLVRQLPRDFPASIFIVTHIPAHYPSKLPEILGRNCELPVAHAVDGEKIRNGHVYVGPPDRHMMIDHEHVRLTRGPKENNFRPAIDVLFRSAALSAGSRVTGVVLSGILDDGSAGLYAIKSRGGRAVVQDPSDAPYPDMAINAMKIVEVDHCVAVSEMGILLTTMANEPAVDAAGPVPEAMELEVKIALNYNAFEQGVMGLGELTSYTCPECRGAVAQIKDGKLTRFRCHTGHAFTLNTMLVELTKSTERSLWVTLEKIEEAELVLNHIARHLKEEGDDESADVVLKKSKNEKHRAKLVRELLLNYEILSKEQLTVKKSLDRDER